MTLAKTPGGKIEAVALTQAGRTRAEVLDNGLNKGKSLQRMWIDFPVEEYEALQEHAGRALRTPEMLIRFLFRQYLEGQR